jgi:hypothetical protein
MSGFLIKVFSSAIMVAIIAEIGRRSSFAAALLAAFHVTTILALIWLYIDTQNTARVAMVAQNTFWLIIPSLVFFAVFPILLKMGWEFAPAMLTAMAVTAVGFFGFIYIAARFGINLTP